MANATHAFHPHSCCCPNCEPREHAFCGWCEKPIPVGRRDYCGPECRDAAEQREARPEDDGGCDWCGSPTDGVSRFCSAGCARAAESDHA